MKRKSLLLFCLYSFSFFLLSAAVTASAGRFGFEKPMFPLLIGFSVIVANVIAAIIMNDHEVNSKIITAVCSVLNSVALGFAVRAWYMFRHINNPFPVLILVAVLEVVYLSAAFALFSIKFVRRHFRIFWAIFTVLTIAAYVLCAVFVKADFVSTAGYWLIVQWIFALAMIVEDKEHIFPAITLASFGVFIVALIILVIILAEDDGPFEMLELVDIFPDSLDVRPDKKVIGKT